MVQHFISEVFKVFTNSARMRSNQIHSFIFHVVARMRFL